MMMRLLSSRLLTIQRRSTRRVVPVIARLHHSHQTCCTILDWRDGTSLWKRPPNQYICARSLSSLATADLSDEQNKKTIPFLLADIGEGIAEVELLQWFVAPGDAVAQFDRVCEVQSDKATVEITSRYDGIVESLNGKVGDMVSVGSPLMYIAVADDGTSASDGEATPGAAPTLNSVDDEEDKLRIPSVASKFQIEGDEDDNGRSARAPPKQKVLATPAVRKLGMDYNLDLGTIMGTGPGGRVLKSDVLQLLKDSGQYKDKAPVQESRKEQQPAQTQSVQPSVEDTTVPIRGYNRLMVKSMTASLQIPQMVYSDEINMNMIRQCREDLKPLAESHGVKLSFLPFALKAASLAMKEYPVLNSTIDTEEYTLTYHGNHNIGVAMDTARGLAVPVVKSCQDLSVLDIALELGRLQQAASEGDLSESDISGATFTLSNIGAIGGTYMSPIVSPPQVAIGAMGKIQRLPRFVGNSDTVEEVHVMQISWGGDHRVIDGASMARFSNQWKAFMESPASMMFSLK